MGTGYLTLSPPSPPKFPQGNSLPIRLPPIMPCLKLQPFTSFPNENERPEGFNGFGANAPNLVQITHGPEGSMRLAIFDDLARVDRADAGQRFELGLRGGVEIHRA